MTETTLRIRTSLLTLALAGSLPLAGLATAAQAHPTNDFWDGSYELTDPEDIAVFTGESEVPILRQSDNVEFVAHVQAGPTSDVVLQRREGKQVLRGEVFEGTLDIAVMGGTDVPGMVIVDVTDPTAPVVLSSVTCGGFHSDVVIHENWVVQAWDGSARPCEEGDRANRHDVDRAGDSGIRIYDVTDPADPVLVRFYGTAEGLNGVHNVTVNGEAGLVYLNMAGFHASRPPWGYVDLNDPELPLTIKNVRDWSRSASDGCHDASVAPERQLLACAGITASYIWDISDPTSPVEVAVIPVATQTIDHGARWSPDERILVLGEEIAGAAVATPCTGGTQRSPIGGLTFYDTQVPQSPVVLGHFSMSDTEGEYCTTHFYGFQPGTGLATVAFYDAGIEVVDYTELQEGVPGTPDSYAVFEPDGGAYFGAYPWHGYVYGGSFEYGANDGVDDPARGLWIIKVEGIDDVEPAPTDEGNTWGRWNQQLPADVPLGPTSLTGVDLVAEGHVPGALAVAAAEGELPATGGGLVALGGIAVAAADLLRRRRTA